MASTSQTLTADCSPMLSQPFPQRGLGTLSQRMRTYPNDPRGPTSLPKLPWLEKKVDAPSRPAHPAVALAQRLPLAKSVIELVQQLVEMVQVIPLLHSS